jgi:hypothetical protein
MFASFSADTYNEHEIHFINTCSFMVGHGDGIMGGQSLGLYRSNYALHNVPLILISNRWGGYFFMREKHIIDDYLFCQHTKK